MIQQTMYVLAVLDLEKSAAYYRDQLGFEVHIIDEGNWNIFRRDNCRIMAGHCADAIPPKDLGDHSYFAYWTVDNATALFEEFKAREVEILKPIRDEPWEMREFAIRTLDGHRIMIGESLSQSE